MDLETTSKDDNGIAQWRGVSNGVTNGGKVGVTGTA
jgi:hypothetical protein